MTELETSPFKTQQRPIGVEPRLGMDSSDEEGDEPIDPQGGLADLSHSLFVALDQSLQGRRTASTRTGAAEAESTPRSGAESPPEAAPHKPEVKEQTLNFRDSKITIKTSNGVATYVNDGSSEWDSTDGKVWTRRGSNGVHTWRGTIRFDENNNYIEEGTTHGVTRISRPDGSTTTSIKTKAGKEISLTESKDGKLEYTGTEKKWQSNDGGKTWTSGTSTWKGQLGIDSMGRMWREPEGGKREIGEVSEKTQAINERVAALERKYNISIGEAGKQIKYDYSDPETDTTKSVNVALRLPTMDELETLDKCLAQYQHLAPKTADGFDFKGMKFSFVSGAGDGEKVTLWGWYNAQKEGLPQIFFGPRNAANAHGWEGFEGTVLHETAHHLQSQRWTKDGGREVPKDVMDTLGWRYDKASGNYQLRDKDGKYWENHSVRLKDKDSGKWYYSNRWYPVVDGTVVKEDSRARTTRQMFDSIPEKNRPSTQYFTYPTEAHAEALAMLLQKPEMLYKRNANLYQATRRWDQGDITQRYGLNADKQPAMIRGADGNIVANTPENRKKVADMEAKWSPAGHNKVSATSWEEMTGSGNREEHRPGCEHCRPRREA
ncbi:MAG: hypothetical protein U0105_27330 [Candidatus Obscuribacterales bacterium]